MTDGEDKKNPAGKAGWVHRRYVLRVAGRPFIFRTMSLYDVYELWPHVGPFWEAKRRGKPNALGYRIERMMEVLNPTLLRDEEAMKAFTPGHIDELIEFYETQDWQRMRELGSTETVDEEEPGEEQPEELRRRFMLLCAAGARFAGMPITEFVEQRFEFCADCLATLSRAKEDADAADRMKPAAFFEMLAGIGPVVRGSEEEN